MNKQMIAVAVASMLVGGVAVAAYDSISGNDAAPVAPGVAHPMATSLVDSRPMPANIDVVRTAELEGNRTQYADVIDVDPVRESRKLYATVLGSEPVRETSTVSSPRQVCEDVVVNERLPERDGNVGGTVAGAVIGGLLGNQVGGGNGKKAATAAGAVAGGFIGNRVDRNHVGGRVTQRVDRQCRTVSDSSQSSRVVAYNVTYRNPDGTTGTMRTGSKPGNRISLGSDTELVGYDVTYRHDGATRTVRMDERPGDRLPVVNGEVVTRAALLTRN